MARDRASVMRILYLADGGSVHTYRFLRYFVGRGYDLRLLSMKPVSADVKKLNIKYYENRLTSGNFCLYALVYLARLPWALWHIRRSRPDVLHVHDAFCYGVLAYLSRLDYILTPWGSDLLIVSRKSRLFRFLMRKVIRRAKLVLYEGENLRERLKELGAREEKLKTFCFSVDVNVFSPVRHSAALRSRLGATDTPLIVSTRNLEPVYDVATFIKAAALVRRQAVDARFLVVGDGTEREKLEQLADELKMSDRLCFVGRLPVDMLSTYLASCDIYVSSALSDAGIAASTTEAMACGLAVVTTDFGDNARWVHDGENGFLFEARNPQQLSERIITLIKDKKLRGKCGKTNVALIRKEKNHDVEMERIGSIYESTANG